MTETQQVKTSVTELQNEVQNHPYSLIRRLNLCDQYVELEYPDLAAGEAYLALLLCDEITDESGEFHDEATEAAVLDSGNASTGVASALDWLAGGIELAVYTRLVSTLNTCGCMKNALLFCTRGLQKFEDDVGLSDLRSNIEQRILHKSGKNDISDIVIDEISDGTKVRREVYPWNTYEPDRCAEDSIQFLNKQLAGVAPKLEVRAVELPDLSSRSSSKSFQQLGLYAKADITAGEEILNEKSLLTGTNRLLSEVCDACSLSRNFGSDTTSTAYCEDCTDTTVFCSTECHDLAMQSYHPAICDTDALAIGKDPAPKDAADAMYAQLLLRVFAMSITQDIHPLDLPEIKYLCGTFTSPPSPSSSTSAETCAANTLPFNFHHNIQLPLHFLERMDINIFTASTDRFSTSVINTLYAKLRGVASAKQGSDGLPEVAAVHPLWCLANHSCAPNVRWEWNGSMRFWAREEPVAWTGQMASTIADTDDDGLQPRRKEWGIKAGEEILSHYCDISLPVKERREWAAGALGGECRCERCIWELQGTTGSS